MADKVEITLTDLEKKHPNKPAYEVYSSLANHVYQDDGEIATKSIALNREALEILRAKIRLF